MGQLVNGVWHNVWYDTKSSGGRFVRSNSQFRNWITPTGDPGKSGAGGFIAAPGRYHLYVSLACPWAHRTLIFRRLKGLESLIPVSVVSPLMLDHGWTFDKTSGSTGDDLYGKDFMYQIYTMADPKYTGRVTVPVLWDTEKKTIVNNESTEIIEMFNSAFDGVGAKHGNFFPAESLSLMQELDSWIYDTVNNGVYKCGFATSQVAYDENVYPLFESLDRLEGILETKRYLTGKQLTASDIRLFTTLIRFDHVYVTHFKTDKKRIVDYPNLFGYLCDIYQIPGVAETVNLYHIRNHYFRSHPTINPYGLLPIGPSIDWTKPHGREKLDK